MEMLMTANENEFAPVTPGGKMQSALRRSVPRETIKSFGREIPYSSKQIPCSFLCREFRGK
jgi:hypothetical protein